MFVEQMKYWMFPHPQKLMLSLVGHVFLIFFGNMRVSTDYNPLNTFNHPLLAKV